MAENKTVSSQAHNVASEQFNKLFTEQSARFTQIFDEMGKAHTKWIEYGNTQLDEMNELMKTQFNYVNELATGWRKLTAEAAKKTAETFKA